MKKSPNETKFNATRLYRTNVCSTNSMEYSPLLHKWRFDSQDVTNILSIQTKYFIFHALLHKPDSIPNWNSTV
jgi:hypothetical protein